MQMQRFHHLTRWGDPYVSYGSTFLHCPHARVEDYLSGLHLTWRKQSIGRGYRTCSIRKLRIGLCDHGFRDHKPDMHVFLVTALCRSHYRVLGVGELNRPENGGSGC